MNEPRIRIDADAWRAGFAASEAGEAGKHSSSCPYPVATTEAYSWHSGYIEGDAKRQGYNCGKPFKVGNGLIIWPIWP